MSILHILARIAMVIGIGSVAACAASIALFIAVGRRGRELRHPIGGGEADEPLERRLNRPYEPLPGKNGTDEEMRQE